MNFTAQHISHSTHLLNNNIVQTLTPLADVLDGHGSLLRQRLDITMNRTLDNYRSTASLGIITNANSTEMVS